MPKHPHEGRRQAQVLVQPETRATAKLDREDPGFAGIVLEQPRIELVFAIEITHAALKPRLPTDAQAAQLLRVAYLAVTTNLRNVCFYVAMAVPGGVPGVVIGTVPQPIVTPQDGQRFNSVAYCASNLAGLARRDLRLRGKRKLAGQNQPHRGAGAQT